MKELITFMAFIICVFSNTFSYAQSSYSVTTSTSIYSNGFTPVMESASDGGFFILYNDYTSSPTHYRLVKFTSTAVVQWVQSMDIFNTTYGYFKLSATSDSGVYVGFNEVESLLGTGQSINLYKFDYAGNCVFHKSIDTFISPLGEDGIWLGALVKDSTSDNFAICNYYTYGSNGSSVPVQKIQHFRRFDSSGNILYELNFDSFASTDNNVNFSSIQEITNAGMHAGYLLFDETGFKVMRIDGNGSVQWVKALKHGSGYGTNLCGAVQQVNNVYILGITGAGALRKLVLKKIDLAGNTIWSQGILLNYLGMDLYTRHLMIYDTCLVAAVTHNERPVFLKFDLNGNLLSSAIGNNGFCKAIAVDPHTGAGYFLQNSNPTSIEKAYPDLHCSMIDTTFSVSSISFLDTSVTIYSSFPSTSPVNTPNYFSNFSLSTSQTCVVAVPAIKAIADDISVFPNPFNDEVIISTPLGDHAGYLRVADVTGKTIHNMPITGSKQKLSTVSWPRGIYIVSVVVDDIILTKKMVK